MVDVDAALAAMRQLLGSGQAPQWPQPEFGQPVPPAAQWDGDASDRAQQVSQQLVQIIDGVQKLTPNFEMVNEGMQSQSQGAQQISEALSQLSEAAQQTVESLKQSNLAIEQLNEATRGLQEGVSRFTVN